MKNLGTFSLSFYGTKAKTHATFAADGRVPGNFIRSRATIPKRKRMPSSMLYLVKRANNVL